MSRAPITPEMVLTLAQVAGLPEESLDPPALAERLEMILRLVEEASAELRATPSSAEAAADRE
jgi:hypothetical protein